LHGGIGENHKKHTQNSPLPGQKLNSGHHEYKLRVLTTQL